MTSEIHNQNANQNQPSAQATLLTAPGSGGIAVVSLTGQSCEKILAKIIDATKIASLKTGQLSLVILNDSEGERIDEALICKTKTGFEVNIHGGPAVTRKTLNTFEKLGATLNQTTNSNFCAKHPNFQNDAIGAELFELLPFAQTPMVACALTSQWSAGLSKLCKKALCEFETEHKLSAETESALQDARNRFSQYQKLATPANVVLAGAPNAGKSTLANLLTAREVSIVHDLAGTTRDWVRELAIINGLPVMLTDTAGLFATDHHVDALAVTRAQKQIESADLVLLLCADQKLNLPDWVHATNILNVATKCDIHTPPADAEIQISALTGSGINTLKSAILKQIGLENFSPQDAAAFTKRQHNLLKNPTPNNLTKLMTNQ